MIFNVFCLILYFQIMIVTPDITVTFKIFKQKNKYLASYS